MRQEFDSMGLPKDIRDGLKWGAIALGIIGVLLVLSAIEVARSGRPGRVDIIAMLGLVIKALNDYGKWVIDYHAKATNPNVKRKRGK